MIDSIMPALGRRYLQAVSGDDAANLDILTQIRILRCSLVSDGSSREKADASVASAGLSGCRASADNKDQWVCLQRSRGVPCDSPAW